MFSLMYFSGALISCLIHFYDFFFTAFANCNSPMTQYRLKRDVAAQAENQVSLQPPSLVQYSSPSAHIELRNLFFFSFLFVFAFIAHTYSQNIKYLIQGHCSLEPSRWNLVLEFKVATTPPHQWIQNPPVGPRWKIVNWVRQLFLVMAH